MSELTDADEPLIGAIDQGTSSSRFLVSSRRTKLRAKTILTLTNLLLVWCIDFLCQNGRISDVRTERDGAAYSA